MNEKTVELLFEALNIIKEGQEQRTLEDKRDHERKKALIWASCIIVCVAIVSFFFSPSEIKVDNTSNSYSSSISSTSESIK